MYLGAVTHEQDGGWSAEVHHAIASELVAAFDPEVEYVVVESHYPARPGWLSLPVPVTSDPTRSRPRVVRSMRYDLLVTPTELLDIGEEWNEAGEGGLYAWQTAQRPPEHLALLPKQDSARQAALHGVGVQLLIDLPHAAETAALWSPAQTTLDAALRRLKL